LHDLNAMEFGYGHRTSVDRLALWLGALVALGFALLRGLRPPALLSPTELPLIRRGNTTRLRDLKLRAGTGARGGMRLISARPRWRRWGSSGGTTAGAVAA